MKNAFKKTVGLMLASSIICAFMATGCTASESGEVKSTTPDTKLEQQAPSEAESDTKEIKLEQQTLIDEITGVEVTGELPVGAEIVTTTSIMSTMDFYGERLEPPYTVEGDFPECTGSIAGYLATLPDQKAKNIAKIMNMKDWAQWESYAGGMLHTQIYFVIDSEIVEFESDLTVTLPYNYRRGLVNGGITDEATAIHYDYDNKEFVKLELVPVEDTPKGMFQFKTKSSGRFFIGGESYTTRLIDFYANQEENSNT
jgi:hypothetical protein